MVALLLLASEARGLRRSETAPLVIMGRHYADRNDRHGAGDPTREATTIRYALKPLLRLCCRTAAEDLRHRDPAPFP